MRFSDITTQSPDLADSPYGGQPGWGHVDKYGPGIALGDLDGDGNLNDDAVLDIIVTDTEQPDTSRGNGVFAVPDNRDNTRAWALTSAWQSVASVLH